MALVQCWECEAEISSEAPACPKCGAPPKPSGKRSRKAEPSAEQVADVAPVPVPSPTAAKKPMGTGRRLFNVLGAVFLLGIVACGGWHFFMPASLKGITRALVPSVTPEPITRVDQLVNIDEDKYQFFELPMSDGGEVQLDVRVASGPAIDIYFMDMVGFGEWKKAVSKVFGGQLHFFPQLTSGNTRAFQAHGRVNPGRYVLILDNTNYGDAHPPMNGANDVATVQCKVRTD